MLSHQLSIRRISLEARLPCMLCATLSAATAASLAAFSMALAAGSLCRMAASAAAWAAPFKSPCPARRRDWLQQDISWSSKYISVWQEVGHQNACPHAITER